jgi:predicted NAD/FAD-binding protein
MPVASAGKELVRAGLDAAEGRQEVMLCGGYFGAGLHGGCGDGWDGIHGGDSDCGTEVLR